MPAMIHHSSSAAPRRGVALLMVLLIVMAITIISAGFIARTDTQFACGTNMDMRVQIDQLADSALEQARGLLLRPQDVATPYWEGGQLLQLMDGSPDYYDITVSRDSSDPTDYSTYDIVCEAYRIRRGQRVGNSRLLAEIRLDPCIALWTKTDATFRQNWILHGDVCTQGQLISQAPTASLDGDVFATGMTGTSTGRTYAPGDLSLAWPPVTTGYLNAAYLSFAVSGTLNGNYSPARIWKCSGDLALGANVTIQGMLLVTGNLTVAGSGCRITAGKNLPALYVGGNLLLESADNLRVEGLAVVDGNLQIRADASNVNFLGGLCLAGTIAETTPDASGNGRTGTIQGNPTWTTGQIDAALRLDGIDDYVDCGNDLVFDITNEITVAAWVKTEDCGNTEHNPFVTKGDQTYALKHSKWNRLEFFVYSDTEIDPSLKWKTAQIASSAAFNNTWHHVAGTFDGSTVKLYLDGVLRSSVPYAGTIASRPNDRVFIGSDSEWLDRFYRGAIDDVRIYDRALDEAGIGQIKAGSSVPNLVARWRLDGPGSRVTLLAEPVKAAIAAWIAGMPEYWSPAGGAFFRSVERQ